MAFDFALIKKHPYWIGGGVVGVLFLYWLYSRSSGEGADTSSGASPSGTPAAGNLQQAQINAGIQGQQIAAQVANHQVDAQLQASTLQTASQLSLGRDQVAAQIAGQLAQIGANVRTAEIQSDTQLGLATINGSTATNVAFIQGQTSVLNTQAQADALTKAVTVSAQSQVLINQSNNQVKLAQIGEQKDFYHILASKGKLGGDSTGVATVLSGVYGRGPDAIAAQQPTEVANSTSSIIGSIGGAFRNAAGALLR